MSQGEDLDAIQAFFLLQKSKAKTPEAIAIANSFLIWYEGLSWYAKSLESDTIKEAEARRDQFNRANATTPVELAQVETVIATGLKTDQMSGKAPMPAAPPQKLPVLQTGSKLTVYVKKAQDLMGMKNLAGGYGTFGPLTTTTTKAQQKKAGLKQTGIIDDATWRSLGITTIDQLNPPAPGFAQPPPIPVAAPPKPVTVAKVPVAAPKPAITVALAKAKMAGLGAGLPTWMQWILGLGIGIAAVVGYKKSQER